MQTTARRSGGVILAAAVVALAIWSVARLLGVELTVGKGADPSQVGPAEVLATTVIAGLLAWGTHHLLARSPRTAPLVALRRQHRHRHLAHRAQLPRRRRRRRRPDRHARRRRRRPHLGLRQARFPSAPPPIAVEPAGERCRDDLAVRARTWAAPPRRQAVKTRPARATSLRSIRPIA
jgi:Family of unknown function (DUF6069)